MKQICLKYLSIFLSVHFSKCEETLWVSGDYRTRKKIHKVCKFQSLIMTIKNLATQN